MKTNHILLVLVCASFCALVVSPVLAASPKSLGKYGYWSTYKLMEGANPVCYMSITAKAPVQKRKDKKKKTTKRGDVVLMITHRPAESATDVISYAAGTKFRAASDVNFKMGDRSFSLFTQGDTAWSRDQVGDHAIVAALRASSAVTVTGIAANEASIADTVNLKGMPEAYYAIGKACGLAVEPPPKAVVKKAKAMKASTVKAVKTPKKPNPPEKTKVK
ncbi:MAG: invasion associated locus B family protein [Alphaproteobacteria bacterium]|nr:invasion associated locus B family protein [Alphaproteobacteria bacterium]